MMPALATLRRFAGSRQGRVALGGTAVAGVAAAGLLRRRKAGGDPAANIAPPWAAAPAVGTSGANVDAFPTINSPGIDVGQFEQLLADLGRLADNAEQAQARTPTPRSPDQHHRGTDTPRNRQDPTPTDLYRQAHNMPPVVPHQPYLPGQVIFGPGNTYTPATAPRGSWQPGYVWDSAGQQWRPPG